MKCEGDENRKSHDGFAVQCIQDHGRTFLLIESVSYGRVAIGMESSMEKCHEQ